MSSSAKRCCYCCVIPSNARINTVTFGRLWGFRFDQCALLVRGKTRFLQWFARSSLSANSDYSIELISDSLRITLMKILGLLTLLWTKYWRWNSERTEITTLLSSVMLARCWNEIKIILIDKSIAFFLIWLAPQLFTSLRCTALTAGATLAN